MTHPPLWCRWTGGQDRTQNGTGPIHRTSGEIWCERKLIMSTLTATAQPAPGSSLKRLVVRHPLVSYFVLAFAGAWIFQIPLLLAQNGFGFLPWTLPTLLFTIPAVIVGPFLAALVVAAVADGRAGLQQLLRAYARWRVRIRWYVLALLFFPGLLFLLTVLVLHRN